MWGKCCADFCRVLIAHTAIPAHKANGPLDMFKNSLRPVEAA